MTNHNPRTAWLFHDDENAFLAECTPSALFGWIVTALHDPTREPVTDRAATFVESEQADWDGEWARLVEHLWR